jgi:23S rRNA pseudouridine1911/1915/1917 synthase
VVGASPRREVIPAALAGERLDRVAAMLLGTSRAVAGGLVDAGGVRVDGVVVTQRSARLDEGNVLELDSPAEPVDERPGAEADVPVDVVYEDADVVIVDKPAGLVVHPGAGQPDRTLMNALLAHAPRLAGVPRAGIVHRLDKDTSGLLVVAKNVEAQADLARQLADRSVRRLYLAVVQGDPPASGVVDAAIGRDVRSRVRMAVSQRGKPARTAYRVVERFGHAALLECRLETGRTHQIRVHLQHIRHPLVGDATYRRGTRHGLTFSRQALHAGELTLTHPRTRKVMTWRAPLPRDMKRLLEALRKGA